MHLIWIGSLKHVEEFDNICVPRVTLKRIASAVKAEDEALRCRLAIHCRPSIGAP